MLCHYEGLKVCLRLSYIYLFSLVAHLYMANVTGQTRPTKGKAKASVARGSHFKRHVVGRSLEPIVVHFIWFYSLQLSCFPSAVV